MLTGPGPLSCHNAGICLLEWRAELIDVTQLPHEEADVVYAIGDIHGRLDLLDSIEAAIDADISRSGIDNPLICYLGDYIDRGPHSAQVIDRLSYHPKDGPRRIFLKGNHEDRMIDFLASPVINGPAWMKFGGREALVSYGLTVPLDAEHTDWDKLRDDLDTVYRNRIGAFYRDCSSAYGGTIASSSMLVLTRGAPSRNRCSATLCGYASPSLAATANGDLR